MLRPKPEMTLRVHQQRQNKKTCYSSIIQYGIFLMLNLRGSHVIPFDSLGHPLQRQEELQAVFQHRFSLEFQKLLRPRKKRRSRGVRDAPLYLCMCTYEPREHLEVLRCTTFDTTALQHGQINPTERYLFHRICVPRITFLRTYSTRPL